MPTTNKCSLCGEFKDKMYFAPEHNRCGECEFLVTTYQTKLDWRTELNEESTIRLQEKSLR